LTSVSGHSARAGPALQALAETDPAIAALSLWCEHRDGPVTETIGEQISYGPDFAALARHEQIGLAAHHILHVALRHPARLAEFQQRQGPGFDMALYNLAADAVVNESLQLSGYALPRPAVTLSGLLDEVLGQDLSPDVALAQWDVDRLYHAMAGRSGGQVGTLDKARTYAAAQKFQPDLRPKQGVNAQAAQVEQAARWRQHLVRAMQAGRLAGRGIGVIGHRIADIPEPQTPWEVILRRTLSRAVTVAPQPSPRRPARRWIAGAAEATLAGTPTPGFEPGLRPLSELPRIVVALDASGSIDDTRLAMFWAEVTGIARRLRAELHLLVFDDGIRHRAQISPGQGTFTLPDMPRGGGTSFRPVIAEACEVRAAALVILTDLDGDAGPPPRGLTVIWAVPDATATRAPYGQLIDLLH
jgi:predicted metal-dependent peptidase